MPKKNIVLIGYRCSGKTSVGKMVAERLARSFLDTDTLIEDKARRSIEEIISRDGWEHFRDIEREVIREVSGLEGLVIATGGGVVTDEENVRNLKKNGFVVWLRGEVEVLKSRMEKDDETGKKRPSLTGEDPMKEIRKVLDVRNPLYGKACDLIIDTTRLTIQEVAESIIREFAEG